VCVNRGGDRGAELLGEHADVKLGHRPGECQRSAEGSKIAKLSALVEGRTIDLTGAQRVGSAPPGMGLGL
jgi:hypothetical protein